MNGGSARIADAEWLRAPQLRTLLSVLDRDGEEARVVGGAVRNALIGEPIGEIDVATTAVPEEVTRRVEAGGMKAVPTGIAHGTITVVVDGVPYEVTTLREDVETYGRHAKVAFGRDWQRDAERRDFTVNALTTNADGVLFDYVGGLEDLQARRVRFIGDPATRIAEDYLRILRFFRFHAAYGHGAPDAAGLAACISGRGGLDQLSRERVRMELLKLLSAPRAATTLQAMSETGILGSVLGGVPLVASFADMVAVEAVIGVAGDPVRRLGALAVLVSEDGERLWQRLRLTNVEHARLTSMGECWWQVSPAIGENFARALTYRLGTEKFIDRVLLAWARSSAEASDPAWRTLATFPDCWVVPVFPLKAADLVGRGVEKGPTLGAAMRAAEEAWIAADFPSDQKTIDAIADRAARTA